MNLVRSISESGLHQEIFIPIRDKTHSGRNQLPSNKSIVYHYNHILTKIDKFFFHKKLKKQVNELEKNILKEDKSYFIHAHTVYSDGGAAYILHKKYGFKYIVNVRNTDINVFYKYGIHLRKFMYEVLLKAEAVVCISYAYKAKLLSLLPKSILEEIEDKCLVIPNGVDDYWHLYSVFKEMKLNNKEISLLFVGLLDKNKNLGKVIFACNELKKQGYHVSLHVIGTGPLEDIYKKLSEKIGISENIVFYGFINDEKKIFEIMDECDIFVMPSYKETFGLAYIEAMTRGLPVIYSEGQGIDGFFEEGEVGFSVDPNNINMITESIKYILNNYSNISEQCTKRSKEFNWISSSNEYIKIYSKYNH